MVGLDVNQVLQLYPPGVDHATGGGCASERRRHSGPTRPFEVLPLSLGQGGCAVGEPNCALQRGKLAGIVASVLANESRPGPLLGALNVTQPVLQLLQRSPPGLQLH